MIKNSQLVFNDDSIYLKDDSNHFVMMRWETDLMRLHCEKVCSKGGDILEIGFGMGIFSEFVHSYNINSHTIVESHPQVYERLKTWSKNYNNVKIIYGDWFNLHWKINMSKYDGIFYDADCQNNKLFRSKIVDISLKEGGVFSYFSPDGQDIYNYDQILNKELIIIEDDIPKNIYHNEKKCYVNWVEY